LHCPGTTGFQRAAPAQNDEVALPREVDDGCAGLSLGHCETYLGSAPCAADRAQPRKKFLHPRWPLMLGLIDIARRDQCPGLSGRLSARRRNVQHDELGRSL